MYGLEPCYFIWGKALKLTPLMLNVLPLALAIVSAIYGMTERKERQVAEKAHREVSRRLDGAEQANWEFARKLPETSKKEIRNDIIRDLRLPPGSPDETLKQLEQKAKAAPENSRIQKNLYLFRALK
ncbi:MAG TPA: hypothetical protein VMW72_04310 [Sedimentisphaerales bacterium]|nr:hypothetical protein [Sedimentisphaerales bacterium]